MDKKRIPFGYDEVSYSASLQINSTGNKTKFLKKLKLTLRMMISLSSRCGLAEYSAASMSTTTTSELASAFHADSSRKRFRNTSLRLVLHLS